MFGLSWDQVSGFIQRLLMFGGGIAVGRGWISQELMVQIVGALIGIGGVLWGIKVNTQAALVQSVNAIPSVQGVITAPTFAGRELAEAVAAPSTVAAAGTPAAASMAR